MRDKPNDRKEIIVGKTVRTRENRKRQEEYHFCYACQDKRENKKRQIDISVRKKRQKEEKRDGRQDTSV